MIRVIKIYRLFLSPWLGNRCRFYPTCSNYAQEALEKWGFIKGFSLAIWRLLRCHPFSQGGYDPVIYIKNRIKNERESIE